MARHVHVAVAVGAVLDLAALELLDGLGRRRGDGAGLGVGHEATGAEHATERPTSGIRSGVAMVTSKSSMPPSIWAARSSAPTNSAPAASAACGRGVADGEHGDADVLAGARRQRDGAAHHLVGLAGVDAEADDQLDGLVEVGGGQLFTSSIASARCAGGRGRNAWSRRWYFLPFAMNPSGSLGVIGPRARSSRVPGSTAGAVIAVGAGGRLQAAGLRRRGCPSSGRCRRSALGRVDVVGVEVGELGLGDLGELGVGDLADRTPRPGSGAPCRARRPHG
jgi:hypothetical protein